MSSFPKGALPPNSLLAFLDETGSHDLAHVDENFPVFVASTVVCTRGAYWGQIVPAVQKLRQRHFGGPVILHSRDIRRREKAFKVLLDPERNARFLSDINALIQSLPAEFLAAAVHTQRHIGRYGPDAFNPYEWALTLVLERLRSCARERGLPGVHVLAESRTPTLDQEVRSAFDHVLAHGTQFVSAGRFAELTWRLSFKRKAEDIIGTQLADLVGYPVARHVLDPETSHPSFRIIEPKFLTVNGTVLGLKIVP